MLAGEVVSSNAPTDVNSYATTIKATIPSHWSLIYFFSIKNTYLSSLQRCSENRIAREYTAKLGYRPSTNRSDSIVYLVQASM